MHNHYKTNIPELDNKISKIAKEYFAPENTELIRQMFTSVVKLGLESKDKGDLKLLNTNIKEFRYAFNVFSSYRNVRKVVIFGSARTPVKRQEYKMTEELSRKISKKGFMVMTGAGGGIMRAGNKGAGKENSFGVNIILPHGQEANEYISEERLINFKYFFTRKLVFLKESDATVLLPGGFGTLDEGAEALALVQTGKSKPRPIILMESKEGDFWKEWDYFIKDKLLKNGYISKEDSHLFKVANNVDEAIKEIEDFYSVYHSIRYVDKKTVLRLKKEPDKKLLTKINGKFKDILSGGSIEKRAPLKEEIKNNEYLDLHRLVMRFNKKSFGRLMELIRFINQNAS